MRAIENAEENDLKANVGNGRNLALSEDGDSAKIARLAVQASSLSFNKATTGGNKAAPGGWRRHTRDECQLKRGDVDAGGLARILGHSGEIAFATFSEPQSESTLPVRKY